MGDSPAGSPATAVLFPGQGAQVVGMAGDWVAEHPAAARLFARGSEILGYDLLELCRTGPAERLNTTAVSQPAIHNPACPTFCCATPRPRIPVREH